MIENEVEDMDLHDEIKISCEKSNTTILKVIGGWIYYRTYEDTITSTFVKETRN